MSNPANNMAKQILLTILFVCILGQALSLAETNGDKSSIVISTLNLGFNPENSKEAVSVIKKSKSDVMCIQGNFLGFEQRARLELSKIYPYIYFKKGKPGLIAHKIGFLSKYELVHIKYIPNKIGVFGALFAGVVMESKRYNILNLHLSPPSKANNVLKLTQKYLSNQATQLKEIEYFFSCLDDDSIPSFVVGDFNSFALLGAYGFLMKKGYKDSFSVGNDLTKDSGNTFFTKLGGQDLSFRIDYIFCVKNFRVVSSEVLGENLVPHKLLRSKFAL